MFDKCDHMFCFICIEQWASTKRNMD